MADFPKEASISNAKPPQQTAATVKLAQTFEHYSNDGSPSVSEVTSILEEGADVNGFLWDKQQYTGPCKQTFLQYAIEHTGRKGRFGTRVRWEKVAMLLLQKGADAKARDRGGRTPLHYAVELSASEELVSLMLDKGADVLAKDDRERTALNCDPLPSVALLLIPKHDATTRLLWTVGAYRNSNPTFDLLELRNLLQEGASVNATDACKANRFKTGLAPLHYALKHRASAKVVSLLLDSGADVHAQDREGRIALDFIVQHDCYNFSKPKKISKEIVSLLLAHADASTRLLWAVGCYHNPQPTMTVLEVRKLLQNGADVNVTDTHRNKTPLHYVLEHGASLEVVSFLLENGADVHANDKHRETPLHCAVEHKSEVEVISLLLDKGADVHARDYLDRTVLDRASPKVVSLLLPHLDATARLLWAVGGYSNRNPKITVRQLKTLLQVVVL